MGYDIGPKIGIDGEAQFRRQLQDINNGLKTLGSEAKLVASAFDREDKSMEALAATGQILERTMYSLREKLALQNKMLSEAAAAYGEADSRTQAWQRSVNATQAEINRLQRQIDSNNQAIGQASDATGKLTAEIDRQEQELEALQRSYSNAVLALGKDDQYTKDLARDVEGLTQRIAENKAKLDEASSTEKSHADATGKLTAEIERQEARLKDLQREYSNAVLEQGKGSDAAENLKGKIEALSGRIEDNKKKLQDASGALDDNGQKSKDLGKILDGALSVAMGNLATGGLQLLVDGLSATVDYLKNAIDYSSDFADEINTLAAKTGISTDTLQGLNYAAELMDVPVTTVTGSMVKLTKAMDKYRDGNAETRAAFEDLGLSMDSVIGADGQLRKAEDVFYVVIDQLKQMGNTTEADVIANTLFGKSFQDIKPLLNLGTAGIKALTDEAEDMGYVLGTKDLQDLQKADDAFQRWDRTMESVKNRVGVQLAPVLETLSTKAAEVVQNLDWEKVGKITADVIETLGNGIIGLVDNIEKIGKAIQIVTDPLGALLDALGVPNLSKTSSSSLKSSSYSSGISTSASHYTQWRPEGYDPEAAARIAGIEAAKAAASAQTVKVQVGVAPGAEKYIYTDVQTEGNRRGTNLTGGD